MAGEDTEKLIEELNEAATPGKTGILPRRSLYAEAAAEIERLRKAWDFLASNRRFSLDPCGPVYCDDDDQFSGWRVHRESGPINDREWEIVGEGDTPLLAVEAALANHKD